MTYLKKWPLWLWMLGKRLYKKPVFLILLLLIPIVVIGYRFSIRETGTVMTIALAEEAPDPLSQQIFHQLQSRSRLIRYEIFRSPDDAMEHLNAGKADVIWLFPKNLSQHIAVYAETPTSDNAFITVLTRSESMTGALSRERLSSALYEEVAKVVYVNYLRENIPEAQNLTDETLLEYYENTAFSADLFTFSDTQRAQTESNFLLSPLRGLLGVIIAICGLAAAMQYLTDRQAGTFSWIGPRWQILPELSCQLVSVVQLSLISWLCLAVGGLSQGFFRELACTVFYSLCVASFAMVLCRVLGSVKLLSILLPVLCVGMLVLCPVFFDIGQLRKLQYLLPPAYYIRAAYEPVWFGYMALYTAACGGLYALIGKVKDSIN